VTAELATPAATAHERRAERERAGSFLRRGLIGFGVLLLLMLLIGPLWLERQRVDEAGNSFGVRPEGFRGALEVLGKLGYDARRWLRSYGALSAEGPAVLLLLDPMPLQDRPDEELIGSMVDHLAAWVEAGGTLVYAPPGRRVISLMGHDVFQDEDSEWGFIEQSAGELDHMLRDRLLAGLPRLARRSPEGTIVGDGPLRGLETELHRLPERVEKGVRAYLARGSDGSARLEAFVRPPASSDWTVWALADGTQPLVLARPFGSGRVIALSSAYLFANAALRHGGSAQLIAEIAAETTDRGARPILFDEYVHGFTEGRGITRWATQTPLGRVLATALLGVAGLAWFGMVRFGPARAPRSVPRPAREEFVLGLADLYQRAGRYGMAARSIASGLVEDLARARGFDRERGPVPPELAPLLAEAEGGPPASDAALLSFTRRAMTAWRRASDRLRGRGPGPEKGPHA